MNKKKINGFTLIELLAVIILLAVIALIAIPSVINLINEGIKKSFVNSVYGVMKAGDLYYSRKDLMDEFEEEIIFEFPNNIEGLEIKGKIPESGKMKIDENGDITLAVTNGRYCVRKILDREELVVNENIENCILPVTLSEVATTSEELGITTIDNCMLNGVCEPGTPFAINVNDNETYKFYVTEDNGDEITLIMSENTSEKIAWYSASDWNTSGPLTALEQLKNDTNDWTNLPLYDYKLKDDGGDNRYPQVEVKDARARLWTKTEADKFCEYGCPTFLKGQYWLSTAISNFNAYRVYGNLNVKTTIETYPVTYTYDGIRPVITLIANKKHTSLVNNIEVVNDITTVIDAPFSIQTTILPIEANNKQLKWSSSNSNIVTVDKNGNVKGIKAGSASIYVETTDGSNIKKEINITVNDSKKLSEIATTSETLQVTELNSCVNSGMCEPGTPFAIKVNDTEIYKFYVTEDSGNEVTMIMSENLGDKALWYTDSQDNSKGPLTALEALKNATSGWTNIAIRSYTLIDDDKIYNYQPMTIYDTRARLFTETEAKDLGCTSSSCPEYLLASTDIYWLSTTGSERYWARAINTTGLDNPYTSSQKQGIRPVITISK